MPKKTSSLTVRVDGDLLDEWSASVDTAVSRGMPLGVATRSRTWDVNEAIRVALAYVKGVVPVAKLEPKVFDMINSRINFKVAQMIESLCQSMELELTTRLRPDGHLEFRIGEKGTFILPRTHYAEGKLVDEDEKQSAELGEFVTTGKPN